MSFFQQFVVGVASESLTAIGNIFSADKANYTVTDSKLQDFQK